MGGFHKTLGQVYKPIRKIVDPLNIMDPFRILPGSSAGFTNKPFQFDKNFALGLFNAPKNQGTYAPMTKGLSNNSEYFAQQQQMLANMQRQQQQKLANLKAQGDIYPISSSTPTQTTQATQATQALQSPTTTDSSLAQSKINGINAPSDIPIEYVYNPATKKTQSIAANTFQMPDMSNIKFGGA